MVDFPDWQENKKNSEFSQSLILAGVTMAQKLNLKTQPDAKANILTVKIKLYTLQKQ